MENEVTQESLRKNRQSRKLAALFNMFDLEATETENGVEVWFGPHLAEKIYEFVDSRGICHKKTQAGNNFGLVFAEASMKRIKSRGYSETYRALKRGK